MMDKIAYDSRVYSDVQSLEHLRYQTNQNNNAVKKEAAKQFESMLMEIVMRSMRDANKAFSDDLFGSDQMEMYQDMFDKQLSMLTSNSNIGFAAMVEQNIDQHFPMQADAVPEPKQPATTQKPDDTIVKPLFAVSQTTQAAAPEIVSKYEKLPPPQKSTFANPEEFVSQLWSTAKTAAKSIGVDPKVLIAQAALETNWGKKVVQSSENQSTHNLFNIKADTAWTKKVAPMATLEQKNGILTKEKSLFRSYDSFKESFHDYVSFLKENSRYGEALNKAANPGQFLHELQAAGYATDQHYADKIMQIVSSNTFKNIISKLE